MLAKLSISGSIIKIFIVDLYMANRTEDPKNLLSRGMEYGGSGEMTWINHLFSNYLFIIHYKNSTNTVDFGFIYYVFSFLIHIYNAFCEKWTFINKKFWIIFILFHMHEAWFFYDLYCSMFILPLNFDEYFFISRV